VKIRITRTLVYEGEEEKLAKAMKKALFQKLKQVLDLNTG